VAHTVRRFNQRGLAVVEIAAGRGRSPTDTREPRARILAEVRRPPDRERDQTATWSLMLLRRALRATDRPHVSTETIRAVLHEAGSPFGNTRTW
jgi:transposase